jgi:hypothetical protein
MPTRSMIRAPVQPFVPPQVVVEFPGYFDTYQVPVAVSTHRGHERRRALTIEALRDVTWAIDPESRLRAKRWLDRDGESPELVDLIKSRMRDDMAPCGCVTGTIGLVSGPHTRYCVRHHPSIYFDVTCPENVRIADFVKTLERRVAWMQPGMYGLVRRHDDRFAPHICVAASEWNDGYINYICPFCNEMKVRGGKYVQSNVATTHSHGGHGGRPKGWGYEGCRSSHCGFAQSTEVHLFVTESTVVTDITFD